jgi:SAM-dependent methyltransferase
MSLESLKAASRALDESPYGEAMLSYLESFASLEEVRTMKRRSFDLLRLSAAQEVLDVGCGLGQDVKALQGLVGEGGRAVGLDPSRRAVEIARRAGVVCRVGRAEELPFPDGSFDAGRADRVLQYIERPQQAVREMARILRPGGRIVLSEGWIELKGEPDPDPAVLQSPVVVGWALGGLDWLLPPLAAKSRRVRRHQGRGGRCPAG